jgi:hypothetical protein
MSWYVGMGRRVHRTAGVRSVTRQGARPVVRRSAQAASPASRNPPRRVICVMGGDTALWSPLRRGPDEASSPSHHTSASRRWGPGVMGSRQAATAQWAGSA